MWTKFHLSEQWKTMIGMAFMIFSIAVLIYSIGTVFGYSHEYKFTYCFNQVTNSTMIYPEGVECGVIDPNDIEELRDDYLEESEEEQDEKEHEK